MLMRMGLILKMYCCLLSLMIKVRDLYLKNICMAGNLKLSEFQLFSEMPKHFRQCNFCTNNTVNKTEVVIFSANEHIRCALNIQSKAELFICEEHFETGDVRTHGNSKRLSEGSLPVHFPRTQAVLLDHSYVKTAPLDLVSKYQCSKLSFCFWVGVS